MLNVQFPMTNDKNRSAMSKVQSPESEVRSTICRASTTESTEKSNRGNSLTSFFFSVCSVLSVVKFLLSGSAGLGSYLQLADAGRRTHS
jgi:hypothetical protein